MMGALAETVRPGSVDELCQVLEARVRSAVGEPVVVRAMLPQGRGWVGLFEPPVSSAERTEGSAQVADSGEISALGAVLERQEDGWRLCIVQAGDDPQLPAVGELMRQPSVPPAIEGSPPSQVILRAYRPHRRAQLELRFEDGRRLFMKVVRKKASRRFDGARRLTEAASASPVLLPRILASPPDAAGMLVEEARGVSLSTLLRRGEAVPALARCGAALKAFHDMDASPLIGVVDRAGARDWLARFESLLTELGETRAAAGVHLAWSLLPRMPASGRHGPVHGDLHDKQIVCGSQVALLDLDQAGLGDPAMDVGNLLAHLRLRVLQQATPSTAEELCRSFLGAYETPRDRSFQRATRAWEAVSLGRLAGVYAMRPRWRHIVPELTHLAQVSAAISGA